LAIILGSVLEQCAGHIAPADIDIRKACAVRYVSQMSPVRANARRL